MLYQHYTAPLTRILKQFRAGAILFAVGLATVLLANASLAPSVKQEVIVLAGLVVGGCGFVLAMMAQVRMIIARVIAFLKK